MTNHPLDDRIDTPINSRMKERYRKFAKETYGLTLAPWIRVLMQKDVNQFPPRK